MPTKAPPKQSLQESLTVLVDFISENMPRVPLGLLKSKNPEHSHDSTENIMAHPAFRKFNEKETSQIAQMSESLLMPRQIQAQLCSQRESDRPVILQDIYNQVKKIKKEGPLILLLTPSKKKVLCCPMQEKQRYTLPHCFSLIHAIKLL